VLVAWSARDENVVMDRETVEEIKRQFGIVAGELETKIQQVVEGQQSLETRVQLLAEGQQSLETRVQLLAEGQQSLETRVQLLAEGQEALRKDLRHQFGIVAEGLETKIQVVAEGQQALREELKRDIQELSKIFQGGFDEIKAMFRVSYTELDRRLRKLEA
jgi:FtsZ-binding cell division protein ZapB